MIRMAETMRISVPTPFGTFHVFWTRCEESPLVRRIVLPGLAVPEAFADAPAGTCPEIRALAGFIRSFCEGEELTFGLDMMMLESCPLFQRTVLQAEYRIPRGRVSSYGRIAKAVGNPNACRAVGGALAGNPFPIVVPCHRAVKSDGTLGGYQGGLAMKRRLLEMEGIVFSPDGRVLNGWPDAE